MITSSSNQQIKNIVQLLKKAKVRNEQEVFVVEGRKMFEEAKLHGLVKAYASEHFYEEIINANANYFDGFEYEVVKDNIFKEMSETITPQGILAIVKRKKNSIQDIIDNAKVRLLILETIQDPGNLGTMIRTAEGAGINAIILSKDCVDIYNPKVIRSTMGSIYRIPFIYVDDIVKTAQLLKSKGIKLYAAHLKGKNDYNRETYDIKSGLLIGNEGNGLTDELTECADVLVKIPMEGQVESLNAAVAAGILMYEMKGL